LCGVIEIPLPLGKNPSAVQLNNNNNKILLSYNYSIKTPNTVTILMFLSTSSHQLIMSLSSQVPSGWESTAGLQQSRHPILLVAVKIQKLVDSTFFVMMGMMKRQ
jgi:hypothetical protein